MSKAPLALYEKIHLGRGVTITPLKVDGDYVEVEIRASSPQYLDETEAVLRAMETLWLKRINRVIPFPSEQVGESTEPSLG